MHKILIIEDEKEIRENLKIILELYGYNVETSSDGTHGIEKAKEICPDLIICDIMMPGIDGFEVKKIIENFDELSKIPFLFLTAKTDLQDIRKGMNLGADDYLLKPFLKDELLNVVNLRLQKNLNKKIKFKKTEIPPAKQKILVKLGNVYRVIDINEIDFVKANGNYTDIYLNNLQKVIYRRLIKEWMEIFDKKKFVRISQSTIVRLDIIREIIMISKRNYVLKCKNRKELMKISQRYLPQVLDYFN